MHFCGKQAILVISLNNHNQPWFANYCYNKNAFSIGHTFANELHFKLPCRCNTCRRSNFPSGGGHGKMNPFAQITICVSTTCALIVYRQNIWCFAIIIVYNLVNMCILTGFTRRHGPNYRYACHNIGTKDDDDDIIINGQDEPTEHSTRGTQHNYEICITLLPN